MTEKTVQKKKSEQRLELDKRVVDRMVQRGALSRADLEAHLNGLPDLTSSADNIADTVYGAQ